MGNPRKLVEAERTLPARENKNKVINGLFNVNQREVSGTVVLASGEYGHDRFKGGASGCTYTFLTVANVTTITITVGSLIQAVEGLNLQSDDYILSWLGTSQCKINSGSYGDSGLVTETLVGGTNANIEIGIGSLTELQLEKGLRATPFEERLLGPELDLCKRYYQRFNSEALYAKHSIGYWSTTIGGHLAFKLPTRMRVIPTFLSSGNFAVFNSTTLIAVTSLIASNMTSSTAGFTFAVASGGTAGHGTLLTSNNNTASYMQFDAEI